MLSSSHYSERYVTVPTEAIICAHYQGVKPKFRGACSDFKVVGSFQIQLAAFECSLMRFSIKKIPRISYLPLLLAIPGLLIWPTLESVQAQSLQARIAIVSLSPARLRVEANGPATDTWSLRNVYGGIIGLGDRVGNFQAIGARGESVAVRQIAPGEFRSSNTVARFSYEVKINEPPRIAEMSHVSWLNQERGFLMLGDLLPRAKEAVGTTAAVLEFNLPAGWTIASKVDPDKNQKYVVSDAENEVFFVGRALRKKRQRFDSTELVFVTSGQWAFDDSEALRLAGKVIKEYSKVTRYRPPGKPIIMLAPLVSAVGPERWSAETRGSNVVLVLGNNAGRGALLGRLAVVLTHELFHLWVPNALSLEGDYDWFFEGFTLYQALLTALHLRFISFEDYLDTIARVYDSYCSSPDRDKLSLVAAAEHRWTTSSSLVYDKGMLVALVYDLMLRRTSGYNASITDIYPRVFRSAGAREDANDFIMSILNQAAGMEQFSARYVQKATSIDLPAKLAAYGLSVQSMASGTRIFVKPDLQPDQLRLLRSMGYKR
jgi:predicted metalloprotease with PDZ domain